MEKKDVFVILTEPGRSLDHNPSCAKTIFDVVFRGPLYSYVPKYVISMCSYKHSNTSRCALQKSGSDKMVEHTLTSSDKSSNGNEECALMCYEARPTTLQLVFSYKCRPLSLSDQVTKCQQSHLVNNGQRSMNHFCHCHCYCQFRSPGNFLLIVIVIVILTTVISTGNIEVNVVRCPPTSHPRLKKLFFHETFESVPW